MLSGFAAELRCRRASLVALVARLRCRRTRRRWATSLLRFHTKTVWNSLATPASAGSGADAGPRVRLGLAKIRTFLTDTPERIAAWERLNASCRGLFPLWGHTCYPNGNTLTCQDEEGGIQQPLKDPWPDIMACHPAGAGAGQ